MKRSEKSESLVSLDLPTVRPFLAEHHEEVATEVVDFTVGELSNLPFATTDDAARKQAKEMLARLGGAGWCRYPIPEEYGGAATGPDLRACCLIRESLAQVSPLADSVFALQCLGSMPMTLVGTQEQKELFLPKIAKGRMMTAFAMTEPEAGSDVGGIKSWAEYDDSDYSKFEFAKPDVIPAWVLHGKKHLITNAGLARLYVVFAATDRKAGRRGLSCFLVEGKRIGVRFVGPQILSEPHPLGEIAFDSCRLPVENLLGKKGEGFEIGMRTLDRLRATVAAAACGMARRALYEALRHARKRQQFGKSLSEFQLVQDKLARMATELDAARLLTYRAAASADAGSDRVTKESAMAKSYATEAAQRIVDEAVQIIGGKGLLAAHPIDRLYRAVRALRIYEGTTEIQRLIIAKQLLKD